MNTGTVLQSSILPRMSCTIPMTMMTPRATTFVNEKMVCNFAVTSTLEELTTVNATETKVKPGHTFIHIQESGWQLGVRHELYPGYPYI